MEASTQSATLVAKNRLAWVDCFKGLCIVLVVFGHVVGGLTAAKVAPERSGFAALRSWVYLFHMPAFFFASGLFAAKAIHRPWKEFLRSRLATLVYPYCLWSGIVVASQVIFSRFTNTPPDLAKALRFPFEPYGYGLWFLYALFLISAAYQLVGQARAPKILLFVGGAALNVLAAHGFFNFWPILNTALSYLIYFVCGAIFHREAVAYFEDTGFALPFATGIGALGLMTFTHRIAPEYGWGTPMLISLLGIYGLVGLAKGLVALGVSSGGSFLGFYSLEIYLGHILLATLPRPLLQAAGFVQPWIYVLCGVSSGLLGSVALGLLARYLKFPYLYRWPSTATSTTRHPQKSPNPS
jgi:surface polysaccharide O-acyltransferase-like enzyme